MKNKNILITGASGKLGKTIISIGINERNILAPSHSELDITNKKSVEDYFKKNQIDEIIHCAAIASVLKCDQDPNKAISTNSIGTAYLVEEALKNSKIRFLYISTDYVYPCENGKYKETDLVKPFTLYAWTKYGGELAVKNIPNHCIIRTSFFDPENIPFETAFTDSFCSKIPLKDIAENIIKLLDINFSGIINIGQDRISLYDLYKKYKPSIKPESMSELKENIKRAKDSSLDVSLWRRIIKNGN